MYGRSAYAPPFRKIPDCFPTATAAAEIGALNQKEGPCVAPVANSWLRHCMAVFVNWFTIIPECHGVSRNLSLTAELIANCCITDYKIFHNTVLSHSWEE